MTIAACHLSPEGVVLGADSATTISKPGDSRACHLDYAQKMFEVGKSPSTVGLVTWGLGQIGQLSHRTLAARVGACHECEPYNNMQAMARRLAEELWLPYREEYQKEIVQIREGFEELKKKDVDQLSESEVQEIGRLEELNSALSGGYCLAGRVEDPGPCEAWLVLWSPLHEDPVVQQLPSETPLFWGVPDIMERLIFGFDRRTLLDVLESGQWSGTPNELIDLVTQNQLIQPDLLPIREAIDWVHTVIHTTIRGTKFAKWPHWCGGPVEVAVITTDRPFRWVRHKELDAAIITAEEGRS